MELPSIGPSAIEGQGPTQRGGAGLISMARGVAAELDLVDVILIVGPPLIAALVHGFGSLMNSYIELERM
ncbi:MAG: hypothetical protein QOK15_1770 [Nocardioidaceae bacterium]|jgi:hypothetical protein|nr:hypothetical protein [Nocardioidaceae bacterium]